LAATPVHTYKIRNTYPHDSSAFTQGLVYKDGILYESTGLRGRSSVRRVTLETGNVLSQTSLLPEFFGEGIAVFGDRIYQLTWTTGVGFVYDKKTLALLQEFRYGIEGWGMTHDGKLLIVSDGSSTLYYWDPKTLREVKRLAVTDRGNPVTNLNELELVEGEIYANVWQQDRIARISPETGKVTGWIDMKGLLAPADRSGGEDVLNGVAYDPEKKRLFVTGKLWPKLFEIEIVAK
ncbi:MAG: glutaminyl-peptide cyclotransferase, partial [Vicinamibacteria bacterium]